MSALTVGLAGALYALAAFAVSLAVGYVAPARSSATQTIDAYRVKLMCVTLGSAGIGAFAETRGLTPLQAAASALVVAALAAAITADRAAPGSLLLYVSCVPLGFVIFAAALDGLWTAIVSALLAAAPFLMTVPLVRNRTSTLVSATVAALAGASIGIAGAFFILCLASVCALALTTVGRPAVRQIEFAPYIAAFTLFGIFFNMSVSS